MEENKISKKSLMETSLDNVTINDKNGEGLFLVNGVVLAEYEFDKKYTVESIMIGDDKAIASLKNILILNVN